MFLLYVLLNSCAVYVKAAAHRFFYKVTITVSGLGVAVPTTVLLKLSQYIGFTNNSSVTHQTVFTHHRAHFTPV